MSKDNADARQGIPDNPMESVTTAPDEAQPEYSMMESSAAATDNGAAGGDYADNWDMDQDDPEFLDEEGAGGQEGAEALAAARAHLTAVAEELAIIQNHFGSEAQAEKAEREAAYQAERDAGARLLQEKQDALLQSAKDKRHVEVDLQCANARADRLATEKEELLAAQARMEAELRAARKTIEDLRLQLQHRDMDLGKPVLGEPDASQSSDAAVAGSGDTDKPAPVPLKEIADQAGLAPRPAVQLSKQQAVAALRAAQGELREERKRRERLERRVQKDKERLERLVAVAEAQQKDNRMLQMRCHQSEASAQEAAGRFQETATNESGAVGTAPPFGGRMANNGNGSPGLVRQQSAPTRLPNVARR